MNTLDYWKPHKLEEHGSQQASKARDLLGAYGANFTPSNRDLAESQLDYAEELRSLLKRRCLLARLRRAREYDRKAVEALHTVESMLDP